MLLCARPSPELRPRAIVSSLLFILWLRRRFELMSLQRTLKALGTFGFMSTVRDNPVYLPYIPRTLAHARQVLVRHPELERLWQTLAGHVEELS